MYSYFDNLTDSMVLDKADEDMIDALSAIPTQSIESTTENISAYDAYDPSKFNPDDFTMTSTPVDGSL